MSDYPPPPILREAWSKDAGRSCPYCRFALKEGAEVVECGSCHAPHHTDCWSDNGGCAVMGCLGAPGAASAPPPPPRRRPPRAAPPPPAAAGYPPQPTYAPPPAYPPPPAPQPPSRGGRGVPVLTVALLVVALVVAGVALALVLTKDPSTTPADGTTRTVTDDGGSAPAPAPAPAPASGSPLPDVDEETMRSDIRDVLLAHHEDLVNRDFRGAWELTTKRYRAKKVRELGSFEAWADGQQVLASKLGPSGLQVAIRELDRRSGIATLNVTGMRWSGSNCTYFEGVTWAKYEDGNWRYEPGYSISDQRRAKWQSRFSELLGAGCV